MGVFIFIRRKWKERERERERKREQSGEISKVDMENNEAVWSAFLSFLPSNASD